MKKEEDNLEAKTDGLALRYDAAIKVSRRMCDVRFKRVYTNQKLTFNLLSFQEITE